MEDDLKEYAFKQAKQVIRAKRKFGTTSREYQIEMSELYGLRQAARIMQVNVAPDVYDAKLVMEDS